MFTGTVSAAWRRNRFWCIAALAFAVKIVWLSGEQFSGQRSGTFLRWLLQAWRLEIRPELFDLAHSVIRKGAHVAEYAIFAALVYRAISMTGWIWRRHTARPAFGIAVVWAALDELHQFFVQGRTASVPDLLLDAAGAGLGLAVVFLASRRMQRNPAVSPAEAVAETV